MLPEGWCHNKLSEVVSPGRKISYGIVQPGVHSPDGIFLIRGRDYSFGWAAADDFFRVSREIDHPYRRSKVQPNDLLLTIVGAGTGNVAIVPAWLDGANITQTTARVSVDASRFDYRFIKALLESGIGQQLVYHFIKGGAQPGLNIGDVEIFSFLIPPLPEQRAIADILSTWDQAIVTVEKLIANARAQKRAMMQQLLTGKARLPGYADPWVRAKFSTVFDRIRRKNKVGSTNVLTISAQQGLISQRDYFNKNVASDNVVGYTLLHRGDFAYNKSYSHGYPMGAIKPLERYETGIVSSLYICFALANNQFDHGYFRHFFESGCFDREIYAIAQEGARNHGLLNVSVVDFFHAWLTVPPKAEQVAIAERINAAEAEANAFAVLAAELRQEKAALMQQLLTGKRRVKIDASINTLEEAPA